MQAEILMPVVALAGWSLVMFVWMMAARLPAMKAAGVRMNNLVGTTGAHADRALPPKAQWPAHNYNHLMEQPTLFYAVSLVLAVTGSGDGASAWIAWGYAALRIAHSVVQATVNRVTARFVLFIASTFCLAALTLRAALAVF